MADSALEELVAKAMAAGCLQAVMSVLLPDLTKFVDAQRARVARMDSDRRANSIRRSHRHGRHAFTRDNSAPPSLADHPVHPDMQKDLSTQLKYLREHWRTHLRFVGLDDQLPVLVQRALLYRNRVAHQSDMTLDQYEVGVATFEKVAELTDCSAAVRRQMRALVERLMPTASSVADSGDSSQQITVASASFEYLDAEEEVGDPTEQDEDAYENEEDELEARLTWQELHALGNAKFKEGDLEAAIASYTRGIELTTYQAVLFSNRAACYLRLKQFVLAEEDANEALDIDSETIKHYRLLSEAYMGLQEYDRALETCEEGLVLDARERTLLERKQKAIAMIEVQRQEEERKNHEKEEEERRKVAAAFKKAQQGGQRDEEILSAKENTPKSSNTRPNDDMEFSDGISYEDIPANDITVHSRDTQEFVHYRRGASLMIMAGGIWVQARRLYVSKTNLQAVKKITEQALINFVKAGNLGVAEAWYRMGVLFTGVDHGVRLDPDLVQQVECFHKAAACKPFVRTPDGQIRRHRGVAEAENELGVCFRNGSSKLAVNLERSFTFFLRSAQHGYPMGQYNLALAYVIGSGTPKDLEAATFWMSRAAQHHEPFALYALGDFYTEGNGDPKVANRADRLSAEGFRSALSMSRDCDVLDGVRHEAWSTTRSFAELMKNYAEYLSEGDGGSPFNIYGADQKGDIHFGDQSLRIFRPISAVVKTKIETRATAGGITACNYLVSDRLLESATSHFEAGNADEGLAVLRRADAFWERPRTMFSPKFLTAALAVARACFEKNKAHADAAYALGRWDIEDPEARRQHWKQCIKLNPSDAALHFYHGVACWAIDNFEEAGNSFSEALALQRNPRWLFWLALSKIPVGGIPAAQPVYAEYVSKSPPDERFVPDAYYALASFHFFQNNLHDAMLNYGLAQMAEGVSVRFPALYSTVSDMAPKNAVEGILKTYGLTDTSMFTEVLSGTSISCDFCHNNIKSSQLLTHKLSKCPRRRVVCRDCSLEMVFDELAAHQHTNHSHVAHPAASASDNEPEKQVDISPTKSTSPVESPNCHFIGGVERITPVKGNKPPIFKLKSESGEIWTLRLGPSAASSVAGVAVSDSILIFWRNSPAIDTIDKRVLRVPNASEHYGHDVVLHSVSMSVETMLAEFTQLRKVTHVENGAVCSYCLTKPTSRLSWCGACKRVRYCSRDCQKIHWKRSHRFMCKDVLLLDRCVSNSANVSSGRQQDDASHSNNIVVVRKLPTTETTLDFLNNIIQTLERGEESENDMYMLPPFDGVVKPEAISGSVWVYHKEETGKLWAQFRVGYLTSSPSPDQQQELQYFFQLPPHNPLKLKHGDCCIHLERCSEFKENLRGKGYALGMDVSLDELPPPALAELLDYLVENTNIYLCM